MKTLLLLRHAKPNRPTRNGRDFDRTLTEDGRADALLVGRFLRRGDLAPDAVICSPAVRARETVGLVLEAAKFDVRPLFDERIYEASVEQLIEVVSEAEAEAGLVLVVGHNPGLQELLESLTGASAGFTPATLARIDLDLDAWSEVAGAAGKREGRLVFAMPPQAVIGH